MSEEVTQELKSCPFCGMMPSIGYDGTAWGIHCKNGKCPIMPSIALWDKDELIAAWNTRAGGK